ncbi:MAG: PhzF family phenazine biosynthesis protein [Gammaproteobacteria bacterium]|nr:PhzF family phenazine biosynthesis protein [Gammaproteobacteria bacterium]
MSKELFKAASFSDGEFGGNPVGVDISSKHPPALEMHRTAMEIEYSETAFALHPLHCYIRP